MLTATPTAELKQEATRLAFGVPGYRSSATALTNTVGVVTGMNVCEPKAVQAHIPASDLRW